MLRNMEGGWDQGAPAEEHGAGAWSCFLCGLSLLIMGFFSQQKQGYGSDFTNFTN